MPGMPSMPGLPGQPMPGAFPGLPGLMPGLPPGLPALQGLPGGLPQGLPGGMTPAQLMANPMAMMMLAQNPAAASLLAGIAGGGGVRPLPPPPAGAAPAAAPAAPIASDMIDPDIQEMCDNFHIEDKHARRLHNIMKNRQNTFEEDLERLWDVLERAREPAGLLTVKMREMEEGTFIGKQRPDEKLKSMSKKFKLDDQAESKLADILVRYEPEKKAAYFQEIEKHLEVSNRPSAMVMMLLKKLGAGEPLGRVGHAAPGSYLDKMERERKDKKDKDRSRSRGKKRSRSKSKSRDRDRDRDKDKKKDKRSRSRRR